MSDQKKPLPTNTPTVCPKDTSKPKRGRKKKVLPEFKIVKASEEKPIVVKFE
jgi:hypothetical protein